MVVAASDVVATWFAIVVVAVAAAVVVAAVVGKRKAKRKVTRNHISMLNTRKIYKRIRGSHDTVRSSGQDHL